MQTDLLSLPTKELLEKFGAGSAKPGSGSAAALTALIACQMIKTVIDVSKDKPSKRSFQKEFDTIKNRLDVIIPELEKLLQEDSDLFNKVYELRLERDSAEKNKEKIQLKEKILDNLKPCTEIPLRIANLSIEIFEMAKFVFQNGVWWVRGDSQVAISNPISTIDSCVSIINLNLSNFPENDWVKSMRDGIINLESKFQDIKNQCELLKSELASWSKKRSELSLTFDQFSTKLKGNSKITNVDIEKLARDIQNSLFQYKDVLTWNNMSGKPLELLNSKEVLKLLNFQSIELQSLGTNQYNEEIAGIIDTSLFEVRISKMYSKEIMNFTLAHELGHALLHNDVINHRERPFDSYSDRVKRPTKEYQADKFASFFLMPEKLVITTFKDLFGTTLIKLNEESALSLTNSSLSSLRNRVRNLRDWSRIVSNCTKIGIIPIDSMSKIFNVSVEAMAIRLEELGLVKI
jgi:formiminotetrahydrofolate cyclodeaminase/Zn-dependent peptidase ImmA (M78 family)